MSELDRAHDHLKGLLKRNLEVNAILEHVEGLPEYAHMVNVFHEAFIEQLGKLLKSNVFKDIDELLHPVQKAQVTIPQENDDDTIYDAVGQNLQPLADQKDHKVADIFADFLLLMFNHGGQDFLNKQNIPATFDLTNTTTLDAIQVKAKATIKGVDATTQQWVSDQISTGRQAGLSNADIADAIKEQVPETYANRADRIVRTETSNMVGEAEAMTAQNNGASHKEWVTVAGACPICAANEAVGVIGIDSVFPSGDKQEPAHPNCRCIVEYQFTPFMGSVWSGQ